MLQNIYRTLIKPKSTNPDRANRELVLNFLLLGVILLALLSLINTLVSLALSHENIYLVRSLSIFIALGLFVGLYALARFKQQQAVVSLVLIGLFFATTCIMIWQWGVLLPTAVLLLGLVIIMAGILLSARAALYAALLIGITLGFAAWLQVHGKIARNIGWDPANVNVGDVVGLCSVFAILALVSWLFNRQMERSLLRARKSEAALARQKALLEIKVEERTRELEAAQLEKVQQVYRFAELGRVSSALFHDLANHLTSVSLDIEGLEQKGHSEIMKRIQRDIKYIDDVVQRVRFQLRGQAENEDINIIREINELIKVLSYKTVQAKVVIETHYPSGKKPVLRGDVTRFRQVINNLLMNAIEAYPSPTSGLKQPRRVLLSIEDLPRAIQIRVQDWGFGISPTRKGKIFEPFYTDKRDGTGIGLFIVQQIIEHDLHGTINVTSKPRGGTVFTIEIPRQD